MTESVFESKQVQGAVLAFLCILFLLLAQNFFLKNTLWMDEALYALLGQNLAQQGTFKLYGTEPTIASPLLPFSIAVFHSLFGQSQAAPAMVMMFYAIAAIAIVFILGRRLMGFWTGAAASALLVFSTLFLFYSLRVLTDMPLMLFTSLSIFFYWTSFEEKKNHLTLLAGAVGAGVLMKVTFPALAIPLAITAFIWHGKEIAAQWKKIALAAIAFIALCIPLFAYNYTSTGSPVGLLSTYFSSALSYGQAMGTPFEQYFLLLPAVFSTQWTILLIAIATVWGLWKKNRALITLAAALFITLLILSAATGWKEDRYILFLLPPGLLLASFAIVSSVKAALKTISEKKDEFLIEAALAVIALFALASGTVLNYGNAAALVTAKIPSYGALQPAGEFIQTITAPGETIVSNSGHELAYYAQRKVLTIGSTIDGFKQDLAKNNATVIAFTVYEQQSTVIPALQKFQDKTLATPTNPYEYVLAGVNTGEFQIVKAVNENIGGQESTSVVIFKKMR